MGTNERPSTMTFALPPEIKHTLRVTAAKADQNPSEWLRELIAKTLNGASLN